VSAQEVAALGGSAVMIIIGVAFSRMGYLMKYRDRVDLIAGVTEFEVRGTFNLITGEPKSLEPALKAAGTAFGTAFMFFGALFVCGGVAVALVGYRQIWFWSWTLVAIVTVVTIGTVVMVRRRASRSDPPVGPISPS
jgi:hypothetical protein